MTAPVPTGPVGTVDPIVYPACLEILAAIRRETARVPAGTPAQVAAGPGVFTFPGPPAHYRVVPGTENVFELSNEVDICCQGVAWVRVANFYHSMDFPNPAPVWEPGGEVSWAVVCEVGIVRCSYLMSPDPMNPGQPPSDDQYNFASQVLFNDAAALRRLGASLAKYARPDLILDYVYGPGPWDPIAVEGNCMGGVISLTVQVPAADQTMVG